ncbi:glutathione S-transferase family protein [Sphingomicrobium astaxanthinifaciens]|uniref:glutathione S-transferase family protein n=1 Tax=Sphingomicrobium astaxanthinifaciens TaxID=1227949 RepID=UPI001FCA4A0C|nr:glutathione S-transferase family protein [Sphingomicrobium astaxanthinifaciens]MCJ7422122.1 glutathione S-transferase family protein [Sphingomicrobium astaxanthinifaciens]
MKLIIGNRAYSSWSMRAWLALKAAGLEFEELVVPLFDAAWDQARAGDEFAASGGKVPLLWDGDTVVWDSLAIIETCAERCDYRFWPEDPARRGMARSMAAEMHSSFPAIRREMPMNVRKRVDDHILSPAEIEEVDRILNLWAQARARREGEGDYLFGAWSAVDMMFAPVVTRFITYRVPLPPFAAAYASAVLHHAHVVEWIELAQEEPWEITAYEPEKS